MLVLLQPGIEPLGQFDIEDTDTDLVVGGEVAVFQTIDFLNDGYASDVLQQGPGVHLKLNKVSADGVIYGLVDEGSSGGLSSRGYGTLFGQMIGTTVGQGTGVGGTPTVGTVVVGPSTIRGSGKATLWTKPGLYGVTSNAWEVQAEYDAATLNTKVYGTTANGTDDGKLSSVLDGADVALVLGPVTDSSLVSTTNRYAGLAEAQDDYMALYLLGVQS
jgi:hypothetical protein